MLHSEIIVVCSQIHTKKHKRTVWTERRVCVKLAVRIVTTEV